MLRALMPGTVVTVGSARAAFPEVDWIADDGIEVLHVPSSRAERPMASAASREPVPIPVARPLPVSIELDKLPRTSIGRGFARVVLLPGERARGVPLKEGDRVVDKSTDSLWHYRGGLLTSHVPMLVSESAIRVESLAGGVRVLAKGTGGLPDHTRPGDRVQLTVRWRDGTSSPMDSTVAEVGDVWALDVRERGPIISDALGVCFGGNDAKSAVSCVSQGGTWDAPCRQDDECPYYDSRRGRGGCNGGQCELPLGVGRVSFRTAVSGSPIPKHGCAVDDPDFPYCRPNEIGRDAVFARERIL